MSPLFLHDGKLLINDSKLATSENCCCNEYAIFFCNSNQEPDAPYSVFLNNNFLGNNRVKVMDQVFDGTIWVTSLDITLDMLKCDDCQPCKDDLPWIPDEQSTAIRPYPPPDKIAGYGDDVSLFALCQDCATSPYIKKLEFDRAFLKNGNNTLVFSTPPSPWTNPPYDVPANINDFLPDNYGRVWVIKFVKDPDPLKKLKVDSILLSTAFPFDVPYDPAPTHTYNFIK